MSTAMETVPGWESDLSASPRTSSEQFDLDWYPWAGQVAAKFSLACLLLFAAHLGFLAFVLDAPSRDAWSEMRHDASLWAFSLTMASFVSALTGFLLGIHARRTKDGNKAIAIALATATLIVAEGVFLAVMHQGKG